MSRFSGGACSSASVCFLGRCRFMKSDIHLGGNAENANSPLSIGNGRAGSGELKREIEQPRKEITAQECSESTAETQSILVAEKKPYPLWISEGFTVQPFR